jgi:hypothetical protein
VRFLEVAPLGLAASHSRAGDSHAHDPTQHDERTKPDGSLRTQAKLKAGGLPILIGDHAPCDNRCTGTYDNGGPDEPCPRSLHTIVHLLELEFFGCEWRNWRHLQTGRIKAQL